MIFRIFGALALLVALAGCDTGLSLNPTDWFGPKDDIELVTLEPEEGWAATQQGDYRGPVAQVTSLQIERASGGYLIRATGLPPRLGYWDAELVPENRETPVDGVMSYTFRIAPPPWRTRQSSVPARTVHIAHFVSDLTLGSANRIRVIGANNSLTAGR
ncbi:hypothetical protein [Maritimibacter dapengensis]|uniref:Lipoprotein n=1 Tax=Maritimibacter dapengensis TaxID=2836868 RepID=A0ABS6T3A2_9RHOB|nr:hypothetical protein [Maritimibacter dapengensis]MBV7379188.1 hypothetical protein [Maritimibacter dapengensis]